MTCSAAINEELGCEPVTVRSWRRKKVLISDLKPKIIKNHSSLFKKDKWLKKREKVKRIYIYIYI